ncbi:MAG: DUF5362 domain-containing protein [candidate division KSB1 bacterium]
MNEASISPSNPAFQMMMRKLNGDMRFVGIFTIIGGALACLGIITAIIGVPVIISGLRLREAADSFSNYVASGDFASLQQALERQGRYFFIQKIFIIIGLVFTGLYLIFFIAFFGTIMSSFGNF